MHVKLTLHWSVIYYQMMMKGEESEQNNDDDDDQNNKEHLLFFDLLLTKQSRDTMTRITITPTKATITRNHHS